MGKAKNIDVEAMDISFEVIRRHCKSMDELRVRTLGLFFALESGIESLEKRGKLASNDEAMLFKANCFKAKVINSTWR